jgi:hypothetical protein
LYDIFGFIGEKLMKAGRRKLSHIGYWLPAIIITFLPLCANAGYIDIYENAVINNNLPENSIVRVHGTAHITVQSTSYVTFQLYDSSIATVLGGNATYRANDSSILNLYGGDFATRSPSIGYDGNLAKIYVYGENFSYQPSEYHDRMLYGNWLDENNTPFAINFRGLPQLFEDALGTNIFLVPEPITASLMLLGILGIRKFRG